MRALALLGLLVNAGCAVRSGTMPASPPEAAPSANVRRLDAWRDAEQLAADGEGRVPVVGRGVSMAPIYGDNTMLVLVQVPFEDLAPGMLVAYQSRRGHQIVHRLAERTLTGAWRAIGINNPEMDAEQVTHANFIGVVYASLVHELPEEER